VPSVEDDAIPLGVIRETGELVNVILELCPARVRETHAELVAALVNGRFGWLIDKDIRQVAHGPGDAGWVALRGRDFAIRERQTVVEASVADFGKVLRP